MRSGLSFVTAGLSLMLAAGVLATGSNAEEGHPDVTYSKKGADTCLRCHRDDVSLAIFDTPHGEPKDASGPFGPGNLQCEACHGPGGAHAGRVPRGEERPTVIYFEENEPANARNAPCVACHEADLANNWHDSTHRFEDVACSDCHASHVADDPALDAAQMNTLCTTCHRSQAVDARKPYSHALEEDLVQCTDCHVAHGGSDEFALKENTVNDTCFRCHADKRGPYLWEHAPATEDCGNCHDPHGSNHPGMLTRRAPFLCQSCHSQAGHPSIAQESPAQSGPSAFLLLKNCMNCHSQVHGSNHPSGSKLNR